MADSRLVVSRIPRHSFVWALVVKGSLKFRIEKLGTEIAEHKKTEVQRKLSEVTKQAAWTDVINGHPERPRCFDGAFIYCTKEHMKELRRAVKQHGIQLMSKHIICSPEFYFVVMQALEAEAYGVGREAFLKKRAGRVKEKSKIVLREYVMLNRDAMSLTGVSDDILEYLTLPGSAQMLEPNLWDKIWETLALQNDWLEIRTEEDYAFPFCTICEQACKIENLRDPQWKRKRLEQGKEDSELLTAILEADEAAAEHAHEEENADALAAAPADCVAEPIACPIVWTSGNNDWRQASAPGWYDHNGWTAATWQSHGSAACDDFGVRNVCVLFTPQQGPQPWSVSTYPNADTMVECDCAILLGNNDVHYL